MNNAENVRRAFDSARTFIYRNARPLDFARWRFHFENGGADAVIAALAAYQNDDGGFGHALEADSWNPDSSPLQTWTATEIIRELGAPAAARPIIDGILRYLGGGSGFDYKNLLWCGSIKSNNDYPHAPWWGCSEESEGVGDYNPSVCLAGFILRFAEKNSDVYKLGVRVVQKAYDHFMNGELSDDMHLTFCYIGLLQYCREAGEAPFDLEKLGGRLRRQVSACITADTSLWESSYVCRPSHFIIGGGPDTEHYIADNAAAAEYECGFLIRTQLADGSWDIPWSWGDYAEQWPVAKNWWTANGIISNMRYLREMGRL